MAGVVGVVAVPAAILAVPSRSISARVFTTPPTHHFIFDPIPDPALIPQGAPDFAARTAARTAAVAENRAAEKAQQVANAARVSATNIDTAPPQAASDAIDLFNDDGITFLCSLFDITLDAALPTLALRQHAYGQARISLLQKLAAHRAACEDERAEAEKKAAAAAAARDVSAAEAEKVESEKQKLAAIRSILNVLAASPPGEVYGAIMAATPANLGVMVSLVPGGHAWCAANAGSRDFLEHAAAILAERLGLPARSRGAAVSSTGRGGDGGGEHDAIVKAGVINLAAVVEGRVAGQQVSIGPNAGVLVSGSMTPSKPGPASMTQMYPLALLAGAMDRNPEQQLNGVRFVLTEGLRNLVATAHDTGMAAHLASSPGALDELIYGNAAAVAKAMRSVSFMKMPAPGSLQVAYAPDARYRAEGARRVAESLAAVASVVRLLRSRFDFTHREPEFSANVAAALELATGLADTLGEHAACADAESIAAGGSPLRGDMAAEQAEVADLLEMLLKKGFQLAGDDCKLAFDRAGGGKAGFDAMLAGGRATYPAFATDPDANAAAVMTFVQRAQRRLVVRSAHAAAQTARFASAPAEGGGRFGGSKPGAARGGPLPAGGAGVLPKNGGASLIKLGTIKDASLRACLGAPPTPSKAATAFILQDALVAVLPESAPPGASLCWTQFQLPAHQVCSMNGEACTRETTWRGASRPLYHILPASLDALKSAMSWKES